MQNPTKPPSEQELTKYVVDKLSGFPDREELVFDVCRLMGWQWDQADLFIKAVEEQNFRRIALHQSPWFLAITLGILVGGLVTAGGSAFFMWSAYRHDALTSIPILERAPRAVYIFLIGILMVVGALWGLWVFVGQFIRGR